MFRLKLFSLEWKRKDKKERIYMAAGAVALLLAIVGIFLPVVPQVPFAILAAFFFSRGSLLIHHWIRRNRFFGKSVRAWEDHHVVRPKMKILSTLMMIGGAVLGHLKFEIPWAVTLDVVFALAIAFILSRPSKPPVFSQVIPFESLKGLRSPFF